MVSAKNILQAKFDKVKSFMDNDTFVFTFSKAKAFAIHKDQLFKNQLYNNGTKINKTDIKYERILKLRTDHKNGLLAFLYDSNRLVVHSSFHSGNYGYEEIVLDPYYKTINGVEFDMHEKDIANRIQKIKDNPQLYSDILYKD